LPANEDAFEVFRLADTQWYWEGMSGQPVRLDYGFCFQIAAKSLGIPVEKHEDLLRRLKIMERERLTIAARIAESKKKTDDKGNKEDNKTI